MSSRMSVVATLLRRTLRRNGWGCLVIVACINVAHWQRQGTLDLSDASGSLLMFAASLVVFMLAEARRMVGEARAASPGKKS